MKKFLPGTVVTLLTLAVVVGAWRIVNWRYYQNTTAYNGQLSYQYLTEPVMKTPDGKVITRAQALDALIVQAVKAKQAQDTAGFDVVDVLPPDKGPQPVKVK